MTVVDANDEVRAVFPVLGLEAIGDFKSEVVVLRIGDHLRMRFGDAAEFRFPIAVEDHPIDLVLRRRAVGFPAIGFRRIEANEAR
jgi:hypothetical protein